MRALMFVVLLGIVAGCGNDPNSCHERVKRMAKHFEQPRSASQQRGDASPWLAQHLDWRNVDEVVVALIQLASPSCPEAIGVFRNTPFRGERMGHLAESVPVAIEKCQCKVSPEDVGGLLETVMFVARTSIL
jgi:hypothetical protein